MGDQLVLQLLCSGAESGDGVVDVLGEPRGGVELQLVFVLLEERRSIRDEQGQVAVLGDRLPSVEVGSESSDRADGGVGVQSRNDNHGSQHRLKLCVAEPDASVAVLEVHVDLEQVLEHVGLDLLLH